MDPEEELKLKRLLKELKEVEGRGTELISVYIPSGYDLGSVVSQLFQEQATAANIKSKATRKNVTDALERILQHLRLFKQTPPNGLVIFCGNVAKESQDIRLWSIEPPEPIDVRIYRCDHRFLTEPLEKLLEPKETYGLITIDNKEATLALLKGDRCVILKHLTSGYHGKHHAGGQSQRRFERLIQQQSHEFKMRVGEYAKALFLKEGIAGLIVGGPAGTKNDFVEGDYLHHELKKKLLAVKDVTYTDEAGVRELVNESKDVLAQVKLVRQKRLMETFMRSLLSCEERVVYGPKVEEALELGAVDTLLLSEKLGEEEVEELCKKAKACNAKVELLSEDFEEGYQLWKAFGGKAAILRFKL